jgi:hypothetical protein
VGSDVGSLMMEKLGYNIRYIYLGEETDLTGDYQKMNHEDMLSEIKNSINKGFPVIAIDMIDVAEWGLITGYQNSGEELFCRTYFDKTLGYELAKKFPWVILIIENKIEKDLTEEYDNSLDLAYEMYTTEAYGKYFSGIKALEEWIDILRKSTFYAEMGEDQFAEVFHANWWIFYSLTEAKINSSIYLLLNQNKFQKYADVMEDLILLYEEEVELLRAYEEIMPRPYKGEGYNVWGTKQRLEQVNVLKKVLELEKEIITVLESE